MPIALPHDVSLSLALSGSGAPSRALYEAALEEAVTALDALLGAREKLELLTILEREDDIAAAEKVADALKNGTSELLVLGTGGSALGGRAMADLFPLGTVAPRVRFLDNLDHHTFEALLGAADLRTTSFLAISKSGGTAETMMQTLLAADAIRRAGGGAHLAKHFAVVTEPKPSAMRRFAEDIGCPILDHPLGIGGRYSVLSVVGLLPAIIMGLDARAMRRAARAVVFSAREGAGPAAGAALHVALSREGHLRETVLWPYADRFLTFGAWWRQLWGESLGKEGKGSTPVAVLGPVDQHSQLQLFLDGPGNALFTVLEIGTAGQGPVVPVEEATRLGLGYLAGKSMGDLVAAEARATAETLARRGRPVRLFRLKSVDEAALSALFMHFMLETILVGQMTGVDPFDQPAVEEGKVLARTYLEQK
jgi:glucose-6-phosphate isomerase